MADYEIEWEIAWDYLIQDLIWSAGCPHCGFTLLLRQTDQRHRAVILVCECTNTTCGKVTKIGLTRTRG